jgi:hypothetical protein
LASLGLAKPIKDMGFQLEFNSLAHLVQKLTSYEQRHPNKIIVGLRELHRHRLHLLLKTSHNVIDGAPFPRIGKALYAEVTHHIPQLKAKLMKFLAILHALILNVSTNGSNLSFVGFLSLGLLSQQSFSNSAELIKHNFQLVMARA